MCLKVCYPKITRELEEIEGSGACSQPNRGASKFPPPICDLPFPSWDGVVWSSLLLNLEILSTSSNETGSSGGNETSLLTARSVSGDGGGVTDVLLVTTTMRVIHGVHGNTSNSGPGTSALGLPSVVGVSGLADGLVSSATAGNEADHSSAGSGDGGTGA